MPIVSSPIPPLPLPAVSRWVWIWPHVALLLLALAVGGLLWYSQYEERRAQEDVLINDTLWAEQNLRFQFEEIEDKLKGLAVAEQTGALDPANFRDRITLLLNSEAGIVGVSTVDLNGTIRLQAGAPLPNRSLWQAAMDIAGATARPAFSRPTRVGNDTLIFLAVAEGDARLVAQISLGQLVSHQIPWWFAAKYRLTLRDLDGTTIAAKSGVEAGREGSSKDVQLDPPGQGITMRVTAYRTASSLVQRMLIGAVLCLAGAVLVSWWHLHRHMQGRQAAEMAHSNEHAFRKAMEESLTIGMRARDLEGRIIYVNQVFCKMVGYGEEALLGAVPPYPYWDPEGIERHIKQNADALSGRSPMNGYETRFKTATGEMVDVVVFTAPLIDATGRQRGWMSSVIDVTERKRIEVLTREQEQQLQQATRLSAMGELASTLAHELNQPLMAMSSYASAAKQLSCQPEQKDLLASTLEKISGQADRAAQIIARIREFVRKRSPELDRCNLNTIVEDAVALVEADARQRGLRLDVRLAADLPNLDADRILLQQVLVNLIRNGLDACSDQPIGRRNVTISTFAEPSQLGVRVADRGNGLDEAATRHLFEAFYTTKPSGMGLGLSICRSIVERHHGKLWHEAHPEGGAIFTFTLPL